MIARLRGLVDEKGPDGVVLDVQGVGYKLACSARAIAALPATGQAADLRVETHVREDAITLYGFLDAGERDAFRQLLAVQGVGPKHALAILSVLSPTDLAQAAAIEDKAAVSRADGVGPKLALAALSAMSVAELSASVTNGDTAMLTRIPGVGKKKADRLALELRDKFAALHLPGSGMSGGGAGVKGSPAPRQLRESL
ncbi:MAG: Holliday junction branch migration protein RuvA [Pseudomonadota bacterium]